MQELIEFILSKTLGPEVSFSINQSEDESGIIFTINIPEELRGKVIGKSGRNIKAIRDILFIAARREGKRIFLKIAD